MKKLLAVTLLSFAVLCGAHGFSVAKSSSGKKIQIVLEGETAKPIKLHTFSHDDYFSVRDIAAAYGSRLTFRPVTGKVTLQANNHTLDIYIKSTKVVLDDVKKRISIPTRFSKGEVYVPAAFIMSDDFARFSETVSSLNSDAGVLSIEKKGNVSSPRYYSNDTFTQVAVELTEDLSYAVTEKQKGGRILEVSFQRGRCAEDTVSVNDGLVKTLATKNEGREAVLSIALDANAGKVSAKELQNPTRLVLTVAKGNAEAASADASGMTTDAAAVSTAAVTAAAVVPDTKPFTGKKKIIVLDAGHGGDDPGAVGAAGTKEKEINLAIVMELKKLFEEDEEYEPLLTRTNDTFIPLVERTSFANDKKADMFVSVHCNANLSRSVTGFEAYFLNENASDPEAQATAILENSVVQLEGKPNRQRAKLQELLWSLAINEFINDSAQLCSYITTEVTRRTRVEDRGVKQAGFFVLRGAQMPAVLIECAFISNHQEEAKLKTKKFQRYVADSIYQGVKKYYQRQETPNAAKL